MMQVDHMARRLVETALCALSCPTDDLINHLRFPDDAELNAEFVFADAPRIDAEKGRRGSEHAALV